jgi:hypothetical protein
MQFNLAQRDMIENRSEVKTDDSSTFGASAVVILIGRAYMHTPLFNLHPPFILFAHPPRTFPNYASE